MNASGESSNSSQVSATPVAPNLAPAVNAGPDQTISLPNTATLNGSVIDDGLPSNTLTITWSTVSGPGTVTFGNPNAAVTTANFSAAGSYVLRLTGDDGAFSNSDDAIITVTDLIFANGFESGNLSAWSSVPPMAATSSVSAGARLVGSFGMQALINDNNPIYVTDELPTAESRYRCSLLLPSERDSDEQRECPLHSSRVELGWDRRVAGGIPSFRWAVSASRQPVERWHRL